MKKYQRVKGLSPRKLIRITADRDSGTCLRLFTFQRDKQAYHDIDNGHQQDMQHSLPVESGDYQGSYRKAEIGEGNNDGKNQIHAQFCTAMLTYMRAPHQLGHGIHGFFITDRTLVAAHGVSSLRNLASNLIITKASGYYTYFMILLWF